MLRHTLALGAPVEKKGAAVQLDERGGGGEQLFTIYGLQLLTAVHTPFRYPSPKPNSILVLLFSGRRVPNGMRSGRDQGRGVHQIK